jgi:hypothetical protein
MNTKIIVGATFGIALCLLLASEKRRNYIADSFCDLKDKLNSLKGKTEDELEDLKQKVSDNLEGISHDVRQKVMDILDDGLKSGKKIKNNFAKELDY